MSCEKCEDFQALGDRSYPYRWGRATVLLLACEEHTKEIFKVLGDWQREMDYQPRHLASGGVEVRNSAIPWEGVFR